jgi:hypothetical protein
MPEESRPVMVWLDVLSQIEESLAESLERSREMAVPERVVQTAIIPLEKMEQRLVLWQSTLDKADGKASEAEERIAIEELAVQDWQQRSEGIRNMLIQWGQREAR